jgi:uncharacterized protein
MSTPTADHWKKHLHLNHHVEGGWYSEVYRSSLLFGNRNACTHIYFLLEKGEFSAFHCIQSDELWHFYSGDPMVIYEIEKNGEMIKHHLNNQSLFTVIKAGNWFASEVMEGSQYSLVGCTVSPGFDFADFELATADSLCKNFPAHTSLIKRLCR